MTDGHARPAGVCGKRARYPDVDLHDMIGFAAKRLMKLDVGGLTGAADGSKDIERIRKGGPAGVLERRGVKRGTNLAFRTPPTAPQARLYPSLGVGTDASRPAPCRLQNRLRLTTRGANEAER